MGCACGGQEKARSGMGALLGKGRKPWWPALIFADSQVISSAGSGPATELRASGLPPLRDRVAPSDNPHTVTASIPQTAQAALHRDAGGPRPMKVASIKSANCRSAAR